MDTKGRKRPRRGPRFVFQVDSDTDGAVIRVFDTHEGTLFREIPVDEFVAYAREHKDVTGFLLDPPA